MKTEAELIAIKSKALELQDLGLISAQDFIQFINWVLED
jgi:hypothetical protein